MKHQKGILFFKCLNCSKLLRTDCVLIIFGQQRRSAAQTNKLNATIQGYFASETDYKLFELCKLGEDRTVSTEHTVNNRTCCSAIVCISLGSMQNCTVRLVEPVWKPLFYIQYITYQEA